MHIHCMVYWISTLGEVVYFQTDRHMPSHTHVKSNKFNIWIENMSQEFTSVKDIGSGGIRTHASEETGA